MVVTVPLQSAHPSHSHAGEIIPQAVCSRHGLAVGAHAAWFVRILMMIFAVVAYPISKVLDYLLGAEHTVQHHHMAYCNCIEMPCKTAATLALSSGAPSTLQLQRMVVLSHECTVLLQSIHKACRCGTLWTSGRCIKMIIMSIMQVRQIAVVMLLSRPTVLLKRARTHAADR